MPRSRRCCSFAWPAAASGAGGTAIIFGAIGIVAGVVDFSSARVLFSRWFGSMSDPILLAIPFFVFMGSIYEKSGLAERLLTTIGLLMGPLRGGLALTVVVAGALPAAATGVFDQLGGQRLATQWLTGLPRGFWGFLIVANIAVFILGINLEFLEISFIAIPIFMPAVGDLGIDPIWFLVLMAINLNIAFISPPVGFSLFYLQLVAPNEVRTIDIHRGALPFTGLQLFGLAVVLLFPQTVTWLVGVSQAS